MDTPDASVGCDHAINALLRSSPFRLMSPVAPGLIAYVGRFESGKYPELTKSSP